jgi:hypothetical protein
MGARGVHWGIIPAVAAVLAWTALSAAAGPPPQKLNLEDVLAKHAEAVGPAGARAMVKSRRAEGSIRMQVITGGQGNIEGNLTIESETGNMLLHAAFPGGDFTGERLLLRDGRLDVARTMVDRGARTIFGEFMYGNDAPMREGLMGGVLRSDWVLLDPEARSRLKYDGLKKVEGQDLHQLTFRSRKAAELRVNIYLDPQTFRHVRTTYRLTQPAPQAATPEQASRQRETRWVLEERFDNYGPVDGLQLPESWTLRFTVSGMIYNLAWEWQASLPVIRHNVKLAGLTSGN